MNWGNLLLGDDNVLSPSFWDKLTYKVSTILQQFLYTIWRLLAWVVSSIEGIFRNLAGIGDTGGDMVSEIIDNKNVGMIFTNLVGFSIALIIFFTIVKIIQDHYKETKDGGNPYKTVLRTFKGLLMFFFVSAAVTVGLYASRVMFRALDAATGGGTASVSGEIFRAMAASANRVELGMPNEDELTRRKFYDRITNQYSSNGSYFITKVGDEGKASGSSALAAKYLELFPTLQYGIVDSDGTKVIPMVQWLNTMDSQESTGESNTLKDNLEKQFKQYAGSGNSGLYNGDRTQFSGSVGYKNDILRGIDMSVTPSIDLTWSPVDIDVYSYHITGDHYVPHDKTIPLGMIALTISMGTQWVKYVQNGDPMPKSLEDSAKQFGLTLKGKVALQGGEACASFSFDALDKMTEFDSEQSALKNIEEKFGQILTTILCNVVYTNLLQKLIQIVPPFPGEFNVGPLRINLVQIVAPVISKALEAVSKTTAFDDVIPKGMDGKPLMDIISDGASTYNSGVWSIFNTKSANLDTIIEQYRIDGNFSDLWGQLKGNFNQFINNLETAANQAYDKAASEIKKVSDFSERVGNQNGWMEYMSKVDNYNDYAAGALQNLGNSLALWQAGMAAGGARDQDWLEARNYHGSWNGLLDNIKTTWVSLVNRYNALIGLSGGYQRPTDCYADPCIVPSIYKPIIEFNMTDNTASTLSVEQINQVLVNNGASAGAVSGKVNVNMVIADTASSRAYRMIDWGAYGPAYRKDYRLETISDLYWYQGDMPSEPTAVKVNNGQESLAFLSLAQDIEEGWAGQGGINYFLTYNKNNNNSFYEHSMANNSMGKWAPRANAYWGTNGIYIDTNHESIYYRYDGTTKIDDGNTWAYSNAVTPAQVTNIRSSSANSNSVLSEGRSEQSQLFDLMTMDTTTPLANEFSKHIITLRKLSTADGEDDNQKTDVKLLKDWCKTHASDKVNGSHEEYSLYEPENAALIDYWMTTNEPGTRDYLMLTKPDMSTTPSGDQYNWGEYVGQMSWFDINTVEALYDFGYMNVVVGYIAIIAAVGVYLGFAFSLIQRAINMAVLYIMSPITIAFYPFDDGSKFSNGFVKPFYNEAISAFAIIISLNLFIVLISPIQDAIANVTGSGMLGWLGLVAFITFLPQIRSTVQTIMGGSKMSEKGIADTLKGVKGAVIGADIAAAAKFAKGRKEKLAARVDKRRERRDRLSPIKAARREEKMSEWNAKLANGEKLTKFDQFRMNRWSGTSTKQKKIDEAQAKIASGSSVADATKNLSNGEIRLMNKQTAAADKKARREIIRGANETDAQYETRVAEKKSELLQNAAFKKSVNGNIVTKGASKLAHGAKTAFHWADPYNMMTALGNTSFGKDLKASAVGQWALGVFGTNGSLANDKKSLIGAGLRMHNVNLRDKTRKESWDKMRSEELQKREINEDAYAGGSLMGDKFNKANDEQNNQIKREVAREVVENANVKDKYLDLKIREYKKKGKDAAAARQAAQADLDKLITPSANLSTEDKYIALLKKDYIDNGFDENVAEQMAKQAADQSRRQGTLNSDYQRAGGDQAFDTFNKVMLETEYDRMGGDNVYAVGVAKGQKDLSIQIDYNDASVQQKMLDVSAKMNQLAESGSANVQKELKKAQEIRDKGINNFVDNVSNNGASLNNDQKKKLTSILKNANATTSLNDILRDAVEQTGLDEKVLETAMLGSGYRGFAKNVQNNNDLQRLQSVQTMINLRTKGIEAFRSKIGDGVDQQEANAVIGDFRNVYDSNLASLNPESLGYKQNAIMEKYRKAGKDVNSAECQAELAKVANQMKQQYGQNFEKFVQRNGNKIRQYQTNKKASEEWTSIPANAMMSENIKQRKWHMTQNMDSITSTLFLRDSHARKMRQNANFDGSGREWMMLVNAIQQHDEQLINSLGFDKSTVDTLKDWEENGGKLGQERLRQLYEMGEYDAAHMGTATANMGGTTMQGMEKAIAWLTSIEENQELQKKMQTTINSYDSAESRARDEVTRVANTINTTFAAKTWENIYSQVRTLDDKVVTTTEEFCKALKDTLNLINEGGNHHENDPIVAANIKAIRDWMNGHGDDVNIVNAANEFLVNGIGNAKMANDRFAASIEAKRVLAETASAISETMDKMKDLGLGGK